ncbi:Gfo/Idh/MocA family oxidoreductase [bacterium]|nr:Gfo/Idh/MocA family oxidoreductase [bacterium]
MKKPSHQVSRRAFLAGAAVAPAIVAATVRGADGATAPSDRLALGVIGNGMMGRGHLRGAAGNRAIQVLGVCDVDRLRRDEGKHVVEQAYAAQRRAATHRGCVGYNDYRELLARADLDAVIIATPDHWHSLQSIDAAKAGKDVYCEKPVSVNIDQGRKMADTIRRTSRVFQTGTQYRSMFTIRAVCQFVRDGGLGRVRAAFTVWTRLPGSYGHSYVPVELPLPAEPVPDGLDWNLWVGPAPWHPYNRRYHRNPRPGVVPWAFCESFGVAACTWHHSHSADVVQYGLGVETTGPVEIIHPSSGKYPTLTFRYANGTLHHFVDHWGMVRDLYKAVPPTARLAGNFGGVFVGERGWITSMYGGGPIEGGPEDVFERIALDTRQVTGANDHHANWYECIRTRRQPSSDEEIGHRSASLGHLAIIAFKLGRSLKWDPVKEEFIGDEVANRLRSRALRAPWRM